MAGPPLKKKIYGHPCLTLLNESLKHFQAASNLKKN